jgi:hypothetical protein
MSGGFEQKVRTTGIALHEAPQLHTAALSQPWTLMQRQGDELVTRELHAVELDLAPAAAPAARLYHARNSDGAIFTEVPLNLLPPEQRKVICLPGILLDASNDARLFAMIKLATGYLPEDLFERHHPALLAVSYPDLVDRKDVGDPRRKAFFDALTQHITTHLDRFLTDGALEFAQALLLPLMTENPGQGELISLPLERVQRNFDKLTFLTHCQGGLFLQAVTNAYYLTAERLGWSSETARAAGAHLCALSIASNLPAEAAVHAISSIYLQARNDPLAQGLLKAAEPELPPAINGEMRLRDLPLNRVVVSAAIPLEVTFNLPRGERTYEFEVAHDLRLYRIDRTSNPNQLAHAGRRALSAMVQRSGLLYMHDALGQAA